jgi:hypothetical protein
MATEQDIIRDAIIGTENEIFGDAFGKEELTLDESGDRGPEHMGDGLEGQVEPEEAEDGETETEAETVEAEAKPEKDETAEKPAKPDATKVEETRGRVPAGRLREESEARRAAEAERETLRSKLAETEANGKKQIDELNARFEELRAAVAKPQPALQQQAQVEPAKIPDLFEDPQGFIAHMKRQQDESLAQLRGQMEAQRVETSLSMAHQKHGETFIAAFDAVKKLDPAKPENRALVQSMYRAPNPGDELVRWHKRNETLREVGDDPTSYKARIAEETRKALMADPEFKRQVVESLRADATNGETGKPRNITRLPQSLSRVTGGNGRSPNDHEIIDGSESATFESAWR